MDETEVLGKVYDWGDLIALNCGECHIRFAMPRDMYYTCMVKDQRGIGARSFYCPNGHQLRFHNREIDQLRQERDLLKQRLARVEDEKNDIHQTSISHRDCAA